MRHRLALALVAAAVLAGPAALGQAIPVTTQVGSGTRTMTLSRPDGSSLDSVDIGRAGSQPFIARVTDVTYSRSGYQVTTTMSDLYGYANGQFNCAAKIDSSAVGLGFVINPTSINAVKAQIAPLWDLTGTIDGTLGAALGQAAALNVSVKGVAGQLTDATLAGVYSGVEDALPVKLAAGSAGPYTNPAPHPVCDPAPAQTPTTRVMMDGRQSSLPAMLTAVEAAVRSAADLDSNGTIGAGELATAALADQSVLFGAIRDALVTSGVSGPLLDSLLQAGTISVAQLLAPFVATLNSVVSLLGQSGVYASIPMLTATIPGGTSAGTYRGTLTVTLVDVP